jgi:hypothetical protein
LSISPLMTNNFIDSCAFDPKYEPEDGAAREIYAMWEAGILLLQIAHSTLKETEHPNTPESVKKAAQSLIYTVDVNLTDDERDSLRRIELTLAGDGKVENIKQDARHVFEAAKYGSYFITTDARILKKRVELYQLSGAMIVKPSEFLSTVRHHMAEDT